MASSQSGKRKHEDIEEPEEPYDERTELLKSNLFFTSVIATIEVGAEAGDSNTFYVHESLICSKSEFFRAALKGNFVEGVEKEVKMPAEDPAIFSFFLRWLYANSFEFVDQEFCSSQTLVEAYVLGQKICAEGFVNALMDKIAGSSLYPEDTSTDEDTISIENLVCNGLENFDDLQPDVGLAKWVVDWCAWTWFRPSQFRFTDRLAAETDRNADACIAVLKRLQAYNAAKSQRCRLIAATGNRGLDLCSYHFHADGIDCTERE